MRRLRRILTAGFMMPLVVLVCGLLGTAAAVLWSPPGQALLARTLTDVISARVAGRVHIGVIRGSLIRHVVLEDVVLEDSLGVQLLSADRVEARYALAELLAGRLLFHDVQLERPVIHLTRLRRDRWNFDEIFRTTAGTGDAPARVELRDVAIRGGTIRVDVPSNPQPPRLPTSRNGAEPAQPEFEETSDGLVRIYGIDALEARIPLIRISTPKRDPLLVRIAALRGRLSDPLIEIVALEAEITTQGDSLNFRIDRAELPNTRVSGAGKVHWPRGPVLFDFAMKADTVDLDDLRWISPDFPAWQGRGEVVALSPSDTRTDYRLTNLVLGNGVARAAGSMVAVVDVSRGLGFRELDLALTTVSVGVMRPYLDTLPVDGTLDGRLRLDGFLDAMRVAAELQFTDALVPGKPTSQFRTEGVIHFGSVSGAVFDEFQLLDATVALGTVQRLVPAMLLPGKLHLVGRLNGQWEHATFDGLAEHFAPNLAVSRLLGVVQLDTRQEVLGVAMDATFDRLSFDALRTGYPDLTARGGLIGRIVTSGNLASLHVDADVSGDIGDLRARGVVTTLAPRFGADSLQLDFTRLDLDALLGRGESTALNGRMVVSGTIDSAVAPVGAMQLHLDRSRVGGITFDEALLHAAASNGMVQVDSATVRWPEGQMMARGALGWTAPDSGALHVEAWAASLQPFDSLLRAMTGISPDTLTPRPLDGLALLTLDVHGALDDSRIIARVDGEDIVLDGWSGGVMAVDVIADSLGARGLNVSLTADAIGNGAVLGRSVAVELDGRMDSLTVHGNARLNDLQLSGLGMWRDDSLGSRIGLDSLALHFPRQQWRLTSPTVLRMTDRLVTLEDTLALETRDGSGTITLVGSIPGATSGNLSASIVGLDVADVVGLMQRDTSAVAGLATLDLRLGGTSASPTLRGSAAVTGPVLGDVRAPSIRAAFDYQERLLRSRITFWKTGDPVLEVEVALPYDMALEGRTERKLPGQLAITARADSVDLAVFEAFTPNIRNTAGTLQLEMQVAGTWGAPRFDGTASIRGGRARLPSLNATYGGVEGRARFSGDSLILDSLNLRGDGGTLRTSGTVRFEQLTRPILDLRIRANNFLAMDVPNFLKLRAGDFDVTLRGPFTRPVLRGSGTLTGSVLYFADLVTKEIIDLEDPAYLDLVDTLALRKQRLGAEFQNRFLDSLRIEELRFRLGEDVWLRSGEANVQLVGSVTVNKTRKLYRLAGAFQAPRGTYTLKIPYLPPRDFNVESGTVSYFGSADLNAELNLQARHVVRTLDGDDIPIVARIEGTIQVPRLTLSSPGRNLPERDLISYLMFGRPEFQLGQNQSAQLGQSLLLGALSGEIERALVNDAGIGIDLFEFRPGVKQGESDVATLTQLLAGFQLSRRFFVTFNAGFCLGGGAGGQAFSRNNLGASLEYRLLREWKVQASAEPVGSCLANSTVTLLPRRYQFGADLLWEREY